MTEEKSTLDKNSKTFKPVSPYIKAAWKSGMCEIAHNLILMSTYVTPLFFQKYFPTQAQESTTLNKLD